MNDFIGREVPDNPQPIVMMFCIGDCLLRQTLWQPIGFVLFIKPTVFCFAKYNRFDSDLRSCDDKVKMDIIKNDY